MKRAITLEMPISALGSQRDKLKDFHGMKLGYSSQFGSRHLFEKGFQAGLKAGYDGYSGCAFRAVDSLRSVSASLEILSRRRASPTLMWAFSLDITKDLIVADQNNLPPLKWTFILSAAPIFRSSIISPAKIATAKATVAALPWAMRMGFCCVQRVSDWKPASNLKQHSSILALQLQYMYPAK